MFIARSKLDTLKNIRGFSFYKIDDESGWYVMARQDHEGGKIISPLKNGGCLTPFGQDVVKSIASGLDVYFCFFLLDRHKTEHQVFSHMQRCVDKHDTIRLLPGKCGPIELDAVYRVS